MYKTGLFLAAGASVASAQNIVELASTVPSLSTLYNILATIDTYADLVTELSAAEFDGTVFAPNNDAFDAVNSVVNCSDSTNDCTDILRFHLIQGTQFPSAELPAFAAVSTTLTNGVNLGAGVGQKIVVTKDEAGVELKFGVDGTSTVTGADNQADNGIVHIVDSVLVPPASTTDTVVGVEALQVLEDILLARPEILAAVEGTPALTIFAPVNTAFPSTDSDEVLALLGRTSNANIDGILTTHVLATQVFSGDLVATQTVTTLGGDDITITLDEAEGAYFITYPGSTGEMDTAKIVGTDITTQNAVVHLIDTNFIKQDAYVAPPSANLFNTAASVDALSTLAAILSDARYSALKDVVDTTNVAGDLTVFAPTNDAFAALFDELAGGDAMGANLCIADDAADATVALCAAAIQYHVVPGEARSTDLLVGDNRFATALPMGDFTSLSAGFVNVMKNEDGEVSVRGRFQASDPAVADADVVALNGVAHVVDQVIRFPELTSATATAAGLTELAGALTTAELVGTVDALAGSTIFAPANAAFEAIEDVVNSLSVEDLTSVLTYHVVASGAIFAEDLVATQNVTTLQGEQLLVEKSDMGVVTVTDQAGSMFTVVLADVVTKTSVVHVIDGVVIPSGVETGSAFTVGASMVGASIAAAVALALA